MHNPSAAQAARASPSSSHSATLAIDVTCDGSGVRAAITDGRDEVVSVFAELTPSQQTRLADDAWFLGLRCLMNAHRLAAESRFEDVKRQLAASFESQLAGHQERQQTAFLKVVQEYFDPRDGRVPTRIDAFLRDAGALAQTMARYLAPGGELEACAAE